MSAAWGIDSGGSRGGMTRLPQPPARNVDRCRLVGDPLVAPLAAREHFAVTADARGAQATCADLAMNEVSTALQIRGRVLRRHPWRVRHGGDHDDAQHEHRDADEA